MGISESLRPLNAPGAAFIEREKSLSRKGEATSLPATATVRADRTTLGAGQAMSSLCLHGQQELQAFFQ